MADQADRLVIQLAQGLQLDHRCHLAQPKMLRFFTAGEAVAALEQHRFDAEPLG
ncbi:hypothetical protein D9M71_777670 [compost metagenome]